MESSFDKYMFLQCSFCDDISKKVFGQDSDHIYIKWINCDNNILSFLSSLDDNNRHKLFNWVEYNYNNP